MKMSEQEKDKLINKTFNIPINTLKNWRLCEENNYRKQLYKKLLTISKGEELEGKGITKKIIEALEKLPEHKQEKYYHLIMAELADMGSIKRTLEETIPEDIAQKIIQEYEN
jgi:hypothetical protein